jgi:quercetin dioxygenase-like cupin family protein
MAERGTVRVVRWEDVPQERLSPSSARRAVHGERVTLAQFTFAAGTLIPMHQHEHEQYSYVLDGELEFRIGAEDAEPIIVRSGEVMVLPPHTPHMVRAVVDTFDLDIFSPPRGDWMAGGDQYLRQG